MKVIFVSNYYNHHQAPLAKALDEQTGHNFFFIETQPMSAERKGMGWGNEAKPDYVLQAYDSNARKRIQALILCADAVIWGSCPFAMIRPRLRQKRLTFAYSERIFKQGYHGFTYWGRAVKYFLRLAPYQENHYLLCSSAYAAGDYNRIGLFKGKAYKWGYFPETKTYDIDALLAAKRPASILWAARLIGWKHPDASILVAEKLKSNGYSFEMNLIGNGELEPQLRQMIADKHLEDCVHMLGAMKPEEVRANMEKSAIFLFTSDQNEGWGAVLNESMNSGCAVVANADIGSVPYLIKDGENGLVYPHGDVEVLYRQTARLLEQPEFAKKLGKRAYYTINEEWNAENAARRLLDFIQKGAVSASGPCMNA